MTVQETWFGPADAALLGVWHVPEGGAARGAVVLCPPLGKETVHAYRTMVLAAQQLCELGVAVLRFDYHGCGDSSGDELAPDAVTRWQADVRTAVEHARSTGVPDVALLGLRLGALLAATAAGSCGPLTALALWDPVVSGRRYVREQTVLYRLKVGAGTEGGGVGGNEDADAADAVSLVGAALHPAAVTALGATSLASTVLVDAHTPVLLAARAERTEDPVLTALAARTPVTWLEVTGHERVFDVASFEVTLPGPSTAAVTTWLAARFPPPDPGGAGAGVPRRRGRYGRGRAPGGGAAGPAGAAATVRCAHRARRRPGRRGAPGTDRSSPAVGDGVPGGYRTHLGRRSPPAGPRGCQLRPLRPARHG